MGSGDHTRLVGYVVSPGNRNACHAEAFQPLADLAMRKPHATIACRGRTSDGYVPDLRVATVPIVTIIGSSFGRLGRVPEKKTQPSDMGRAARPSARGGCVVVGSVPPC